ncbi:hypothetical protein [Arthrobacter sp. M4]|uniref:hypothetical protein n=1 Tax=Arthrobacter sp. M4 TaxID=218160 RepID=UPI001CDBF877|nr:hypothetical protein [Arthrobacter sp. M4]MCA4134193.1 hypothetical protein [Arthrobacter sp. M4]
MTNEANDARLFAPAEPIEVRGWKAELRNDELADISFNGIPVLRAIRSVVRDQDWNTLAPTVHRTASRDSENGTTVLLDIDFEGYGSRYTGELAIHLAADSLKVTFDGVAPADFRSNRIGLVVLHRPDDAGRAVAIGSPGGDSTPSNFPTNISPHQPFLDIASMEWERDGTRFALGFSGDVFETEDQRNWTDASFKTYSTPLSKPFPVNVAAGSRVHQSVLLTAVGSAADAADPGRATAAGPLKVTVLDDVAAQVPGLSVSSGSGSVADITGLDSLVLEVQAGTSADAAVRDGIRQAGELGVPLDVRLIVASAEQIAGLLELLPLENVVRLAVFDAASHVTEPPLWAGLKAEAEQRGFAGTLLAGARSHFTELNRNADRLPAESPALAYSITPQMHATEVPHIVETLPIQRLTALNALRISDGRPLHVGPVTLKARFNAVSTSGSLGDDESFNDPLQNEPFTAAWLLGSVAALSVPGVETVSYFEMSGPRGISDFEGLTPAGELLAALAPLRGADVLAIDGSVPGLALYPVRDGVETVVFAANLTPKPLAAVVLLPGGEDAAGELTLDLEPWTHTIRRVASQWAAA